jgi:hypothetical protein
MRDIFCGQRLGGEKEVVALVVRQRAVELRGFRGVAEVVHRAQNPASEEAGYSRRDTTAKSTADRALHENRHG